LEQLLSDAALQQQFKNGCLEVARELGWAEPLDQTEALYATLAGRSANSSSAAPARS
jgi:hypothetical protein